MRDISGHAWRLLIANVAILSLSLGTQHVWIGVAPVAGEATDVRIAPRIVERGAIFLQGGPFRRSTPGGDSINVGRSCLPSRMAAEHAGHPLDLAPRRIP